MKKILSLILSVVMVSSLFVIPAHGWGYTVEQDYTTNEWIDNNMMSVIGMTSVTSWDEIKDMGARAEEIVPRWYMAWYMANLTGKRAAKPAEFEVLFYDLTSEHVYYSEIKGVVEAGYMRGYPDGTFRANEPITSQEAARVLLSVLGYDPYIAVKGYAAALNETKIFEGVPADAEKLNQAQVLRMIYNALMSPAIRQEDYSGTLKEGITMVNYVLDEDYLGLEHLKGYKYGYGVLDGVSGTSLSDADESLVSGNVTIDGVEYKVNDTLLWEEPGDMLGYNVDFYYKEATNGISTIRYMHPNDKNDELVLIHNDIESYSNGTYKYYDKNNKEKSVNLTNGAKILINSIATPSYSEEEMVPDFGTVTFIDNDGKRGYEVVKVDSYEFVYVSTINEGEETIYDSENGRKLIIKGADEVKIYSDGSEITLDRVKKGTMLAVRQSSPNASYRKIYAEALTQTAKNALVASVNENVVSAGGLTYTKWDKLDIEKGETYTFFSYGDEIVMAITGQSGAVYGYLINAAVDGTFTKTISFRLVDMAGNEQIYEGAKAIYIDGVRKDYEDIPGALMAASANSKTDAAYPMAQPVKYELNAKGQMLRIDTLVVEAETYANPDDESFTSPLTDDAQLTYYYANRSLYNANDLTYNAAVVDNSTEVLFIPVDRGDAESYWKKGMINLQKYNVDICDRNDVGTASAVFVYYDPATSGVYAERRFLIISDLRTELDEESGDLKYIVEGYLQANLKTYTAEKELFDSLSVGDVIRVETDRYDKIMAHQQTFDIDKDYSDRSTRMLTSSGATYPLALGFKMIYGTPIAMENGVLKFTQSMPDDLEGWDTSFNTESYITSSASYWKYSEDRGNPTVEKATANDIITYAMDSENVSKVVINIGEHADQIYIIEK